jgi:hypothetical protein
LRGIAITPNGNTFIAGNATGDVAVVRLSTAKLSVA